MTDRREEPVTESGPVLVCSECGAPAGSPHIEREAATPDAPAAPVECPSCDDSWASHVAGLHEEGPDGLVYRAAASAPQALDVERLRKVLERFDVADYRYDLHGVYLEDPATVIAAEYDARRCQRSTHDEHCADEHWT